MTPSITPLLNNKPDRSQSGEQTGNKNHEGNLHIVNGNPEKHGKRILSLIYSERISLCNILVSHFNIIIAQYAPDKFLIICCRESSHDSKKKKDQK